MGQQQKPLTHLKSWLVKSRLPVHRPGGGNPCPATPPGVMGAKQVNAALALTGAGAAKFDSGIASRRRRFRRHRRAAAIVNDSLEHQEALAKAAKER